MDIFCNSPFMEANQTWSESLPYFTHCFEETAILWTPMAVMLSSCTIQILFRSRSRNGFCFKKCDNQYLHIAIYFSLAISALSPFYFEGWQFHLADRVTTVAAIVRVVGYISAFGLRLASNHNGRMFYKAEILFWISSLLAEGILFRTAVTHRSQISYNDMIRKSYNARLVLFPLIIAENVLLLLEKYIRWSEQNLVEKPKNKVHKLSAFNIWLDKLIWKSYWDEDDTTGFKNAIQINPKYTQLFSKTCTSFGIFRIFYTRFGKQFFICGIQRLCQELLGFAAPEILRLFLRYLHEKKNVYTWKDYFFVIMLTTTLFARNIFGLFYWKNATSISLKFRSLLNTAVIQKSVNTQTRQPDTKSTLLNILGADSQKLSDLIPLLHTLWVAPVQLIIAAYLLYNIFGLAAIAGSGVILSLIILTVFISKRIRSLQIDQMKAKDSRVGITTETIHALKVIKLQGWEKVFIQRIEAFRLPELKTIRKCLTYFSMMVCAFTVAPIIILFCPLTIYLLTDADSNDISAENMLIALTIVNVVTIPLLGIPSLATILAQSAVSIKRINEFMMSEEELPKEVYPAEEQEHSVVFNNVWVSSPEKLLILKNLNFKIPKGSLVAIVGDSGSGKSCLLRTILGDSTGLLGNVALNGTTAFTPEIPWLRNDTIKENILFYKEFQPDLYHQVLNACQLVDDLNNNLSDGDKTVVQDNGVNLSGGQKQRISLCRAAYSNAEIYLFDNPLSALDSNTRNEVYSMLISPIGILSKTTRFVVSNDSSLLRDADIILKVQDQTVSVVSQDLNRQCSLPRKERVHTNGSEIDEFCEDLIVEQQNTTKYNTKICNLISKSKSYIAKGGLHILVLGLIFIFGSTAAFTFSNIWLSKWTSQSSEEQAETALSKLTVYGVTGLVQVVLLLLGCHFIFKFSLNAAKTLHFGAISSIINAKIVAFHNVGTGSLLNALSKDMEIIDSNLPQNLQGVILNMLLLLSGVFTICYVTPIFLAMAIPVTIVYCIIQRFYVVTSTKLRRHESSTRTEMYSMVIETLSGISVIKAFRVQKQTINNILDKVYLNSEAQFLYSAGTLWIKARLDILGGLIVLGASVFAVLAKADLDSSVLALSLSSALHITQLLNYFIKLTCELESNMVAVERVLAVTNLPKENSEVSDLVGKDCLTRWPQRGDISFEDVQIQYSEGAQQPALSIPKFSVGNMEKIGILGKTGSGKSTLLLTLFRLLEPSRGVVRISGRDISTIPIAELRSEIAIVPQEPTFFSGTLRFNIDPANIYTDHEIWDSLRIVNLQEYVNLQPLGLYSQVLSEGSKISAGYKQLFCLARALLKNCKILVMDEATSNCDPEIERSILKILKERCINYTVLIIAHRINAVMDCDRIVVLNDGKILEADTVENLMSNKSSYFYEVVRSNTKSATSSECSNLNISHCVEK